MYHIYLLNNNQIVTMIIGRCIIDLINKKTCGKKINWNNLYGRNKKK